MTDGTTGIQVAPISEDEAMKVRDILQRGLDAIMQASQLARDVETLRQSVAQLSDETSRLQRHNESLEEALASSRQRRQQLEQELDDAKKDVRTVTQERDDATYNLAEANKARDTYLMERDNAARERDDWQLRSMELEDQLRKAEAQLSDIKAYAKQAFGFLEAVPEPKPEPAPAPMPEPDLTHTPEVLFGNEPFPTEPDSVPAPTAPTRRYIGAHWEPGAFWDNEKQEYYLEG